MQIPTKTIKGFIDKYLIRSDFDGHNKVNIDTAWLVYLFDTRKNVNAFYKKFIPKDKCEIFSAVTIPCVVQTHLKKGSIVHSNYHGIILISDEDFNIEIAAHESNHAALETAVSVIEKFDIKNFDHQEVVAYLTGSYTKDIYNEYCKRKPRIRLFRSKPNTKSKSRVSKSTKEVSKDSK